MNLLIGADFLQQCDVISQKFSAYNLAGEIINFERILIANRKFELAVAAKSAK